MQFLTFLLSAVQTAATGQMKQAMKEAGNRAQSGVECDSEEDAVSPRIHQQRLLLILMTFTTTITMSPSSACFPKRGIHSHYPLAAGHRKTPGEYFRSFDKRISQECCMQ